MKWLYNVLGVLIGMELGLAIAVGASFYFSQGNALLTAFIAFIALPVGFVLGIIFGLKGAERVRRRVVDDLGSTPRRIKALYLLCLAAAVVGINVICVRFVTGTFEPPSDRQLIANFEQNRTTLERVVAMVKADKGVERIDDSWYSFKGKQAGMKPETLSRYRQLLTSANVPRGLQLARDGRGIKFYYWTIGGGMTSTTMKGYLYSDTPPTPVLSTLDGKTIRVGYRHITGNWYVYYEHVPG